MMRIDETMAGIEGDIRLANENFKGNSLSGDQAPILTRAVYAAYERAKEEGEGVTQTEKPMEKLGLLKTGLLKSVESLYRRYARLVGSDGILAIPINLEQTTQ